MSLTLKYQGQEVSRNKNESSYKETFQGAESEIDSYISSSLSGIGNFVSGKGYLTSWRKFNADGKFVNVEVEYTISYDGSFDNSDSQVYGKKSAQLTVRNIQMPLEHHTNYLAMWNNYLLGLGDATLPQWAETATNVILTPNDRKKYMWVKSISEIPTEPDQNGKYWTILQEPSKPRCRILRFSLFRCF